MKAGVNAVYWHKDFMKGFEACRVTESMHAFPKHVHDDMYSIGLMHKGGCYCVSNSDSDTVVMPDQTFFINPSQVHSGIPVRRGRATYTMLYFKNDLMAKLAGDILEREPFYPEFAEMVVDSESVHKTFMNLYNALIYSEESMELEAAVTEGLSGVLNGCGKMRKGTDRKLVRRAKEFLSGDLSCKVTLEDMAEELGVSRYYLLRTFRKEVGVPPHVYRTGKRIELAKTLLRQGTPFADAALETGFADQSHFSNKFRQFTGSTPAQYADSCSGSISFNTPT
ncbi:AraC family transcriptional regulator [Geovibrio sp. ADMFC3]